MKRLMVWALVGGLGVGAWAGQARAITIDIDYTYDTTNFFGAGNPDGAVAGQQARDALEAAAAYYSEIFTDDFSGISTPADFHSSVFDGIASWEWTLNFPNPSTGSNIELTDQTIQPDQYLVYAGARSIGGTTLGIGGPGGWGWSTGGNGGFFTTGEIDQINAITDQFSSDVETRGEASGFSNWGGAITFDSDTSTDWWYDHTTPVSGGVNDFFSVALHELAHALGFGTSDEWSSLVSGTTFFGSASYAANGDVYPSVTGGHWAYDTMSTVFGTTTVQEVAMDPDLTVGDRKLFTTLDAAAMEDIGWSVVPPSVSIPGDLDGDGFVGLDDLDIILNHWNQAVTVGDPLMGDITGAGGSPDGYVGLDDLDVLLNHWNEGTPPAVATPEPASLVMLGLAGGVGLIRRR